MHAVPVVAVACCPLDCISSGQHMHALLLHAPPVFGSCAAAWLLFLLTAPCASALWGTSRKARHPVRLTDELTSRSARKTEGKTVLRPTTSAATQRTPPQVIHQPWKTSVVPVHFAHWANSWKDGHTDWQYRSWTDEQNRELVSRCNCYIAAFICSDAYTQ